MERDNRIELLTKPWQGFVLPLNQSRINHIETHFLQLPHRLGQLYGTYPQWVGECASIWSGMRESNSQQQIGNL